MKAKEYKTIIEILNKKYPNKKFFLFMNFEDCLNRIKLESKFNDNIWKTNN